MIFAYMRRSYTICSGYPIESILNMHETEVSKIKSLFHIIVACANSLQSVISTSMLVEFLGFTNPDWRPKWTYNVRRTFNMRLVVGIGIDSPITTAALQYRDSELVGQ